MAFANGSNTTNFSIQKLAGTDIAGHVSINAVIDNVDSAMESHLVGLIGVAVTTAIPTGWSEYTPPSGSMPTLPTGLSWVKKD